MNNYKSKRSKRPPKSWRLLQVKAYYSNKLRKAVKVMKRNRVVVYELQMSF